MALASKSQTDALKPQTRGSPQVHTLHLSSLTQGHLFLIQTCFPLPLFPVHVCDFVTAPLREPSAAVIRGWVKLRDTRGSHILSYSSRFWRGSTKQINYTHVFYISKKILLKFKTKQWFTADVSWHILRHLQIQILEILENALLEIF